MLRAMVDPGVASVAEVETELRGGVAPRGEGVTGGGGSELGNGPEAAGFEFASVLFGGIPASRT
jgi:hypothetical protein